MGDGSYDGRLFSGSVVPKVDTTNFFSEQVHTLQTFVSQKVDTTNF